MVLIPMVGEKEDGIKVCLLYNYKKKRKQIIPI